MPADPKGVRPNCAANKKGGPKAAPFASMPAVWIRSRAVASAAGSAGTRRVRLDPPPGREPDSLG
jgi:hypothetical protein